MPPSIAPDTRLHRIAAAVGAAVVALGVLLAGWSPLVVLALYWAENVVIGVLNVVRLLVAGTRAGQVAGALIVAGFFIVHYGLFTLIHGAFVVAIFGPEGDVGGSPTGAAGVLLDALSGDRATILALLVLAATAAIDTARWLASGDSRTMKLDRVMMAPYGRIVVLHVALIGGGVLVQLLGAPAAGVLVLVAVKLWFDLRPPRFGRQAAPAASAAKEAAWKE